MTDPISKDDVLKVARSVYSTEDKDQPDYMKAGTNKDGIYIIIPGFKSVEMNEAEIKKIKAIHSSIAAQAGLSLDFIKTEDVNGVTNFSYRLLGGNPSLKPGEVIEKMDNALKSIEGNTQDSQRNLTRATEIANTFYQIPTGVPKELEDSLKILREGNLKDLQDLTKTLSKQPAVPGV
jgi:hypothetical protein